MTNSEFHALVAKMRTAQNRYFRERSNEALTESKKREFAVDKELAEYESGQKKLFEEGEK